MIYRRKSLFSYIMRPLLGLVLMFCIFGLVRLRSTIVSMEYGIGAAERQREETLRERKVLVAELASLRSIQEVDSREIALTFPDRSKVFYVKRDDGGVPSYTVSLKGE
jgi:hypothetical protein